MLGKLGALELIVVLLLVVLLFGGKKIPEFVRGINDAIRGIQKGTKKD